MIGKWRYVIILILISLIPSKLEHFPMCMFPNSLSSVANYLSVTCLGELIFTICVSSLCNRKNERWWQFLGLDADVIAQHSHAPLPEPLAGPRGCVLSVLSCLSWALGDQIPP